MPRGKPKRTTLITKAAWLPLTRDVKTAQPALQKGCRIASAGNNGPVNTYTHPEQPTRHRCVFTQLSSNRLDNRPPSAQLTHGQATDIDSLHRRQLPQSSGRRHSSGAVGEAAEVASAGSDPAGYVHPMAGEVMKEIEIDISAHTSSVG